MARRARGEFLAGAAQRMPGGWGGGELRGLGADLVAAEQAAISVKRRVFHRLCGRGGGELLEADHGAQALLPPAASGDGAEIVAGEPGGDEFEQVAIGGADGAAGAGERPVHGLPVGVAHAAWAGIDAVDAEIGEQIGEGAGGWR